MKHAAFTARLYRQDAQAQDNWASVLSRLQVARPVEHADVTNNTQLQNEFYASVLRPYTYFSLVPLPAAPIDGAHVEAPSPSYFYVVNVSLGRTREKVMHTAQTADDVVATDAFVVEVEPLDEWVHEDAPPPPADSVRVVIGADACWVHPTELGTFDDLLKRLYRYNSPAPDAHIPGCFLLQGRELARPLCDLSDPKTPTLVLYQELKNRGWLPLRGWVLHDRVLPADKSGLQFDSRLAMKQK